MASTVFFLVGFLIGGTISYGVFRFGKQFGFIDRAVARSSHSGEVVKGGGLGIVVSFVVVVLFVPNAYTDLLTPVLLVVLTGLFADRLNISARNRLVLHFIAASLFLYFFSSEIFINPDKYFQNISFPVAGVFFLVYVVGTANFYNFMDGINGLSVLTGIIAFTLLAWYSDSSFFQILNLCVVGACFGFLPFNYPHAKIFMGDIGSLFLGFLFSIQILLFADSWIELFCLSGFLFPFYADEIISMGERLLKKQSLFQPHRSHLYQVLANERKIGHAKVSFAYGVLQLTVGVSIKLMLDQGLFLTSLMSLILFFMFFLIFNFWIKKKSGYYI